MSLFENNVLGFVRQQEWLDVGFDVTRPNDPIDGLFGDERTDNLMASWQSIAAEYQIPMMAQFHGFDTESQKTFRVPVDTHNIEKGLIKVKLNQSERMRELMRSGVHGDQALYDYVIRDGVRLADQVVTRSKVAKNELMATGKVTIKENGLDLTVDYGVPEENVNLTINFGASDDVPGQIQTIVDNAANKGIMLNGLLTSRAMLSKIRAHESVQKAINGANGVGALVRMDALEAFLASEYGITNVIVNDLSYGASADGGDRPTVTTARYYPANKITFFATNPGGRIGTGLWGDPPEVDAGSFFPVGTSEVSPYVYVMQWAEKDPAVLWTKASALFMPVLYNPESLFIATAGE